MKRHLSFAILWVALTSGVHAQTPTGVGQRQGEPRGTQGAAPAGLTLQSSDRRVTVQPVLSYTVTTAWWTNAALMSRLGLTDTQKSRIEATFEANRQNLISSKELLEKEEAQLAKMLAAETVDRSSAFTQINRVIQARGEMERVNAGMTLEMREQLTSAQWTELQSTQPRMVIRTNSADPALPLEVRPVTAPVNPGLRGGTRGGGNVQQ